MLRVAMLVNSIVLLLLAACVVQVAPTPAPTATPAAFGGQRDSVTPPPATPITREQAIEIALREVSIPQPGFTAVENPRNPVALLGPLGYYGEWAWMVQFEGESYSTAVPPTQYSRAIVVIDAQSGTVIRTERQGAPPWPVDLTVTGVSFTPSSVPQGGSLSVSFTVTNPGGLASGSFSNRVSLATTAWGTTYSLGNFSMGSLGAGASQPTTVNVTIPSSVPLGSYWVTVFTDGFQQIAESNENNNIGSSDPNKVTIIPPPTLLGLER